MTPLTQIARDEQTLISAASIIRVCAGLLSGLYIVPFGIGISSTVDRSWLAVVIALATFAVLVAVQVTLFRAAEAITDRRLWGCVIGMTVAVACFLGVLGPTLVMGTMVVVEPLPLRLAWCPVAALIFLIGLTVLFGSCVMTMTRAIAARARLEPRRTFGFEPVMKATSRVDDPPAPEAQAVETPSS